MEHPERKLALARWDVPRETDPGAGVMSPAALEHWMGGEGLNRQPQHSRAISHQGGVRLPDTNLEGERLLPGALNVPHATGLLQSITPQLLQPRAGVPPSGAALHPSTPLHTLTCDHFSPRASSRSWAPHIERPPGLNAKCPMIPRLARVSANRQGELRGLPSNTRRPNGPGINW